MAQLTRRPGTWIQPPRPGPRGIDDLLAVLAEDDPPAPRDPAPRGPPRPPADDSPQSDLIAMAMQLQGLAERIPSAQARAYVAAIVAVRDGRWTGACPSCRPADTRSPSPVATALKHLL